MPPENAMKLSMEGIKKMMDNLKCEMQKKLEEQVQPIKAEMTVWVQAEMADQLQAQMIDRVEMIKVEILDQVTLLISQLQVKLSKAAISTRSDQPSNCSLMVL